MTDDTLVPFREDDVLAYLDASIRAWRKLRDDRILGLAVEDEISVRDCTCYVDAFQSVRVSIFGATLLP